MYKNFFQWFSGLMKRRQITTLQRPHINWCVEKGRRDEEWVALVNYFGKSGYCPDADYFIKFGDAVLRVIHIRDGLITNTEMFDEYLDSLYVIPAHMLSVTARRVDE